MTAKDDEIIDIDPASEYEKKDYPRSGDENHDQ